MTILTDRRSVVSGIALAAGGSLAAPGLLEAATATTRDVTFCVIGDWGRGTDAQHQVAAEMGRAAARANASSVIAVGDNFYQEGVTSIDDTLWQTMYERVYTHPALQVPWHVALGNHDYSGNPQAQVEYSARSTRWRMPARYFKVDDTAMARAGVDMFVIDTTPFVAKYRDNPARARNFAGQDVSAQLAWLDAGLAASTARWKLVVGHHTIHSGGSQHGDTPELVERLKPILLRQGVQAYIAGHDHDLQHIERDGLHIIQSGGGMEARPVTAIEGTRFCIAKPGFAMITVAEEKMTVDFRDQGGVSLYRNDIPAKRSA